MQENVRIIHGKYSDAIIYAKVVEDAAIAQIQQLCDAETSAGSKIRIMPDCHAGTGCTIGTTMTITDRICVNLVGVDIGCGVLTVNLGKADLDLSKLDEACHHIPSGLTVWDVPKAGFGLTGLRCYKHLKNLDHIACSLGTLGGGNHFIEVDQGEDGTKYLVIHSGSRNLGKQVAEYYQQVAVDDAKGKNEYNTRREELIASLKAQGRQKEISSALLQLKQEEKALTVPEDLCYLQGQDMADYLHDVRICQSFAQMSREIMAMEIVNKLGIHGTMFFHTVHNYIDVDEMILRKGAISAKVGEKVLVPINMRDGSILAVGKGNPDWNYSAPHGAGRIMSRKDANAKISLDEYKKAMSGVYSTTICEGTLDEAPMAYKSLSDIIGVVSQSVDILEVIKPIYNFKAVSEPAPWQRKKEEQ